MKDTDIIKAVAEVDGCEPINRITGFKNLSCTEPNFAVIYKPYPTSRDAIVPVIEKQSDEIQVKLMEKLTPLIMPYGGSTIDGMILALLATPRQLCEALLRACGKWVE